MKRLATLLFTLTTFSLLISACKKDDKNYEPDCNGPAKTYALDVKPAITANCVSCHSQYNTYNGVKNDAAAIRSSIANGSMPKGKKMSDADKNNVICWIDAGAPNN
jgi:hypothetical protein